MSHSNTEEYRFLKRGEKILDGDEFRSQHEIGRWIKIGRYHIGVEYNPNFYVPMRRKVQSKHAADVF